MPHANESERFERIVGQIESVRTLPLAVFRGEAPKPVEEADFPPFGATDGDIFANNLLQVMQFVFNHTSFDPDDPNDQAVLAAYAPLGIKPGQAYDPATAAAVDGNRMRQVAENVRLEWLSKIADTEVDRAIRPRIFQPKGKTDLEAVLAVSIIGPIGVPQEEAVYPQVGSADGKPINALHDYVIHMSKDELPPAKAFWSLTLYDKDQGFFIPNDRKKYSVGKNAGMKLNDEGGIDIYIAAEKPEGVPEENWLPVERKDLDLSPQLRLYVPDLEKLKSWSAPKAEMLSP